MPKPLLLFLLLTLTLQANLLKLKSITLPNGAITSYGYDSQGKKTTQTDALKHSTTWRYTSKGQLETETLPTTQIKGASYFKPIFIKMEKQ